LRYIRLERREREKERKVFGSPKNTFEWFIQNIYYTYIQYNKSKYKSGDKEREREREREIEIFRKKKLTRDFILEILSSDEWIQ